MIDFVTVICRDFNHVYRYMNTYMKNYNYFHFEKYALCRIGL